MKQLLIVSLISYQILSRVKKLKVDYNHGEKKQENSPVQPNSD